MSSFETVSEVLSLSEQFSLASVSAEFEFVKSSQWEEECTARDTASVRLQLLGRVLCCRNKTSHTLDPLQGRHLSPTVELS